MQCFLSKHRSLISLKESNQMFIHITSFLGSEISYAAVTQTDLSSSATCCLDLIRCHITFSMISADLFIHQHSFWVTYYLQ